jgi:hypothetical protein
MYQPNKFAYFYDAIIVSSRVFECAATVHTMPKSQDGVEGLSASVTGQKLLLDRS